MIGKSNEIFIAFTIATIVIFKNTQAEYCNGLGADILQPFEAIDDGFYLIDASTKVNWFKATQLCRRYGANLASLETIKELKGLSDNLINKGYTHEDVVGDRFWLSGNDLDTEGSFVWLGTGKEIPKDKFWSKDEPSDDIEENCTELWLEDGYYQMNDVPCTEEMGYICEISDMKMKRYKLITFTNKLLKMYAKCRS